MWMRFLNEYKNRGGKVTVGSGSGYIYQLYGFGTILELELLQEARFHPLEVIRAATMNGAPEIFTPLGQEIEYGVIRPRLRADLIVVGENPLRNLKVLYGTGAVRLNDSTEEVEHVGGILYTIKDGIIYDVKSLYRECGAHGARRKGRLLITHLAGTPMTKHLVSITALLLALVIPAQAQEEHGTSAFLASFMQDFDESSSKLADLAGAFSDEQYAWRPAEGVRSVSEAFIHVATANFGISTALGAEMPADMPEDAEATVTGKEEVMAMLAQSQDQVRMAIDMLGDMDLGGTVKFYGEDMSLYRMLAILAGHSHEHLGQGIAYARSMGVTPPWSQ